MNTGPLDDTELGALYRVCERHSPHAYALVRRLHSKGVIADPAVAGDLTADQTRILRLEEALNAFRHIRVSNEGPGPEQFLFTDLIDGTVCVVAYVRNEELANRFNEAFERVRLALGQTT